MNRREVAETIAMAVVKSMASAGILLGSAKWNESDHPRDERGRFTSGGSGSKTGSRSGSSKEESSKEARDYPTAKSLMSSFNKGQPVRAADLGGLSRRETYDLLHDAPAGARITGIFDTKWPKDGDVRIEKVYGNRGDYGYKEFPFGSSKSAWWEFDGRDWGEAGIAQVIQDAINGTSRYRLREN